jgi:hypothetical protein
MQMEMTSARAGTMFALALISGIVQFVLVVLAVKALRRMALAQEATARHLATLVTHLGTSTDRLPAR